MIIFLNLFKDIKLVKYISKQCYATKYILIALFYVDSFTNLSRWHWLSHEKNSNSCSPFNQVTITKLLGCLFVKVIQDLCQKIVIVQSNGFWGFIAMTAIHYLWWLQLLNNWVNSTVLLLSFWRCISFGNIDYFNSSIVKKFRLLRSLRDFVINMLYYIV